MPPCVLVADWLHSFNLGKDGRTDRAVRQGRRRRESEEVGEGRRTQSYQQQQQQWRFTVRGMHRFNKTLRHTCRHDNFGHVEDRPALRNNDASVELAITTTASAPA